VRAELHLDLEEELCRIVDERLENLSAPERLYNVESAARYLDTSEEAVRGLVKRRQIQCNRSATGRITFTRAQLDAYAGIDMQEAA
jgi:hypothetical protein